MADYLVYILKNTDGKPYIGQTRNITERLERHNQNRVRSTKNRGPWELIRTKSFDDRSEAMIFEKYLKQLKNKNYIQYITAGWSNGNSRAS